MNYVNLSPRQCVNRAGTELLSRAKVVFFREMAGGEALIYLPDRLNGWTEGRSGKPGKGMREPHPASPPCPYQP